MQSIFEEQNKYYESLPQQIKTWDGRKFGKENLNGDFKDQQEFSLLSRDCKEEKEKKREMDRNDGQKANCKGKCAWVGGEVNSCYAKELRFW